MSTLIVPVNGFAIHVSLSHLWPTGVSRVRSG
jgi:hypothetical protein